MSASFSNCRWAGEVEGLDSQDECWPSVLHSTATTRSVVYALHVSLRLGFHNTCFLGSSAFES